MEYKSKVNIEQLQKKQKRLRKKDIVNNCISLFYRKCSKKTRNIIKLNLETYTKKELEKKFIEMIQGQYNIEPKIK